MLDIGVQTQNVVSDENPGEGFSLLASAGFSCADFSLNAYLKNTVIYTLTDTRRPLAQSEFATRCTEGHNSDRDGFSLFSKSISELEHFFAPHKEGARSAGITINQMHMPYPICVPGGDKAMNEYLWKEMAPKSMHICHFLGCPHIVIHGFKLARTLGSEAAEWERTERFIDSLAPLAKEMGITICVENLYESIGGHLVEGPCCDAARAAERIDRINEKYHAEVLGFCFDTGHANLVGIDFEKFITTLGHRLKVFHIHDNDGISDLHQIPFTFTKTRENKTATDWEGFVRGLENIRFDKVLSFETAPVLSAFPDSMKEDVLKFIARIGRSLDEACRG